MNHIELKHLIIITMVIVGMIVIHIYQDWKANK